METRQDELRDELVALLGAGRELTADTDRQLADAFVRFLEQEKPEAPRESPIEMGHQPHRSLQLAGGVWGAALMFLFLVLVLDDPRPLVFIVVSVVVLTLVAATTRGFLYLARNGWKAPRIRVSIAAPNSNRGRR